MKIFAKKYIWGIVFVLGVLFLAGLSLLEREEAKQLTIEKAPKNLEAEPIPVFVSGIVESTKQATLSAQTSGVVAMILMQEGDVVEEGTRIVSQSTPVADAQLNLSAVEQDLRVMQQYAAHDLREKGVAQAEVRAYTAEEIAQIRAMSNDRRADEQAKALLTVAEQGVLAMLAALDFVDENKSIFDADGREIYRDIVTELYGRTPKHFQGNIGYSIKTTEDILEAINTLRSEEGVSLIDVQNIATLLQTNLVALNQVFATGERHVLDVEKVNPESDIYISYFSHREAVLESTLALESYGSALATVVDSALEDELNQNQTVAVTALDDLIARNQSAYSEQITELTESLANAAYNVALAGVALGETMAPFAGEVADVLVEVGEYVTAGTPLVVLVGDGARELEVTVPLSVSPNVRIGQPFLYEGKVVGYVNRFSSTAHGNVVKVVLSLADASFVPGQSLTGTLFVDAPDDVYVVPRAFLHFDSFGPYIVFEISGKKPVEILHDAGDALHILLKNAPNESLVPTTGINF